MFFFVSAGLNGTASLFQIDGKSNPKIQSVHFENFPIKTAHFTSDGKQFLVGSQHFGHFFAYDMVKGMYWHSVKILEFCYINILNFSHFQF